jgi:cell shape-determining protein MreC
VLDHLRERRTAIIVMAVLTLLTMTLDLRGNALIDRARSVTTDVFAPIKAVGDSASRPLVNAWHGAFEYDDLRRENAQLREQARGNEAIAIEAAAAIEEYLRLRDQVGLPNIGNATPLRADVIGGPISNFEQGSMEINVGANQGVKTGMAVITAAGLVGRITQVTETRAKVRLIWDPTVSVSVKVLGLRAPPTTTTTAPNALSIAPAVAATTTTTLPPTTTTTVGEEGEGGEEGQAPPTSLEPTTTTTTLLPTRLETGLLRGYGRGRVLGVDLIDEKAEVQLGDIVVTSGEAATNLPSLFPRDLPVGRVVEVKRVSGTTQLFVRVEPLADLDDIQTVTVVLYDPVG